MYIEPKRNIFPYHNGVALVYADPLAIYRRLVLALDGEPNRWIEESRSDVAVLRVNAEQRLDQAVRVAFEMAPFDPLTGGGATAEFCDAALDAYLVYLDAKKEPAGS